MQSLWPRGNYKSSEFVPLLLQCTVASISTWLLNCLFIIHDIGKNAFLSPLSFSLYESPHKSLVYRSLAEISPLAELSRQAVDFQNVASSICGAAWERAPGGGQKQRAWQEEKRTLGRGGTVRGRRGERWQWGRVCRRCTSHPASSFCWN